MPNESRTPSANEPPESPVPATEDLQIAVLVPCYNEGVAVGAVVRDFRQALPQAAVYVYDNNSSDDTSEAAAAAGAVVRRETRQGKGHVVRRMFADIDADFYVLVDGDDTYDASAAPKLVELAVRENLAMVVGKRVHEQDAAYRPGHVLGNQMFTNSVKWIFGESVSDILSGYRVFSRRFARSYPAFASGFETETEFTVHALNLQLPIGEIETPYKARPTGSESKLSTYKDGFKILRMILRLTKSERPLAFFGAIAGLLFLLALGLAAPLLPTYLETGLVPRFPTAILATGIGVCGLMSLVCGFVLDTVTRGRREQKMLAYLAVDTRAPRRD